MVVAGELLRAARAESGLSARALAERAVVAASTVVRIEHGRVDPTTGMLRLLLHAAGQELQLVTTPVPGPGAGPSPALTEVVTAWTGSPDDPRVD